MTTTKTDQRILDLLSEYGMDGSSFAKDLLAALQARDQQGPIKTWQERIEETCPAIGPMHIHACVEEVNDAMQAEIDDLRAALQEQAREGEVEQEPIARIMFNDDGRKTDNLIDCDLPVGTLLYAAPQAAQPEPDRTGMKYYKNDKCQAESAHSPSCICWTPSEPAQPESIECDCGRIHKKTRYGWACSEPAQPEQGERTRARSEFWKAALGDNSKLANLAKAAIKEAESPNKSKPAWIGLSTEERDNLVGDLVGYGTETVAPLYSVIEQVERNLKERNASLQYAQPVALPMTDDQINLMVHSQHFDPSYKLKASDMVCLNWYKLGLRDGERAHGIGGRAMTEPTLKQWKRRAIVRAAAAIGEKL